MLDAGDIDGPSILTWGAADDTHEGFTVRFEPRLHDEVPSISFVRVLRLGETTVAENVVWHRCFDRHHVAADTFNWLLERHEHWQFWGRLTGLIGPDRLMAAAVASVAKARTQRAGELLKARKEERTAREEEKKISSYLVEKHGQFGVDLRRGGHKKSFFVVWFGESWERERFRDWWRSQQQRFHEFAAIHDARGGPALERMLMREMQETEKMVKAAGMGAGGRRPLRFYRGDD